MKRLILISASFIFASSAFAQSNTTTGGRCVTAPATVSASQTTITTSGAKSVTENQTYIYYACKHHKRHDRGNYTSGISERYHSKPLMLNSGKTVTAIPESYNVTLTTPQSNVAVCPDTTVNIAANINLERVSSYTGNYPNSDNKTYKRVSKRDYKVAARKMRHLDRKETKIARKSGTSVDVKSAKA